jgi:hypothetical protein
MDRQPLGTFKFKKHPSEMTEEEIEVLTAAIYVSLVTNLDESPTG